MKRIIVLLLPAAFSISASAQIPNGDFEQWQDGSPVGWMTSNGQFTPVAQVTNSHGGSSAAKMQWQMDGLVGASMSQSFDYNGRPFSLNGWYISNFDISDYLEISCVLYREGSAIGICNSQILGSSATYTSFEIPITYSEAGDADSVSISMLLFYTGTKNNNAFIILDDLSLGLVSGIDEKAGVPQKPLTVYYEGTTLKPVIAFSVPGNGPAGLTLTDLNGRSIRQLAEGQYQPGVHRVNVQLENMSAGIYLLVLETNGGRYTEKILLANDR